MTKSYIIEHTYATQNLLGILGYISPSLGCLFCEISECLFLCYANIFGSQK